MIKAIFWDIDGTLLDTGHLHSLHLEKVCKVKGIKVSEQAVAGLSLEETWQLLKLEEVFASYEEWLNISYQGYAQEVTANIIRPGILDILTYCQEQNLKQIAVSNGTRYIVDVNLDNTNLRRFFSYTISCDDVKRAKPDPEPYNKALTYCQLKAEEVIVIEDTPIGIASAVQAGIFTIAFPDTHTKNLDFSQANYIINHPEAIKTVLKLKNV